MQRMFRILCVIARESVYMCSEVENCILDFNSYVSYTEYVLLIWKISSAKMPQTRLTHDVNDCTIL